MHGDTLSDDSPDTHKDLLEAPRRRWLLPLTLAALLALLAASALALCLAPNDAQLVINGEQLGGWLGGVIGIMVGGVVLALGLVVALLAVTGASLLVLFVLAAVACALLLVLTPAILPFGLLALLVVWLSKRNGRVN